MHRTIRLAACAALLGALLVTSDALAAPPFQPGQHGYGHRSVCPGHQAGYASCDSKVVVDKNGNPYTASGPNGGYSASDLQRAYNLPSATAGGGQTIAIVDAFDDPNAASDLATYRSQMGLPACGAGCFTKVNQNGAAGSYPRRDAGWAEEISLDLDMASAICPSCHILLVEASSNSFTNLAAAENTAARLGATEISNSYGGSEFSSEGSSTYDGPFNHPGVAITVSSGDNGYGVEFPAASQYVTAVGGTSLTTNADGSRASETAWSGAGSGCSAYIAKPSWQTDTGCSRRTVADVSAVADPNTGVAVYDTFREPGWMVFGGTSVSAPITAGVYALAGNGAAITYGSFPYSHTGSLNDVTSGSNGSCGGGYLCTARTGFDGPTGLGTPNTAAAF